MFTVVVNCSAELFCCRRHEDNAEFLEFKSLFTDSDYESFCLVPRLDIQTPC